MIRGNWKDERDQTCIVWRSLLIVEGLFGGDHADQILAYLAAEKSVLSAKRAVADAIEDEWETATGWTVTSSEKSYLMGSVERYGMANVSRAIRLALTKVHPSTRSEATERFRYLCGILRNWARGDGI